MKEISKEQNELIITSYSNGIPKALILKDFGITIYTLNKILAEKGLLKTAKNSIKGKHAEIIKLYQEGKTLKEIAEMFGTYNTSIRRVLLKYNIPIRSNSKVQRLCKHNPFKKHDEYSDYFLGLLLTDGTITKCKSSNRNYQIVLSLNERDGYMIEKFRDWASPNTKISKIYQKINASYMHSCNITNEEAVEWLRRKGNFYNKSYNCKIYTPLNFNILRGIFDGDGGFHKVENNLQFFICGASKVFMEQILRFLIKHGFKAYIHNRPRHNNNAFYYVEVYALEDVIKLGKLLYDNAHIYLTRKYEKWLAFYENKRANTLNSGNDWHSNPERNLIEERAETIIGVPKL